MSWHMLGEYIVVVEVAEVRCTVNNEGGVRGSCWSRQQINLDEELHETPSHKSEGEFVGNLSLQWEEPIVHK